MSSPRLAALVRRECGIHQDIAKQIEAIATAQPAGEQEGLSRAAYNAMASVFANALSLFPAWQRFNAQLVM